MTAAEQFPPCGHTDPPAYSVITHLGDTTVSCWICNRDWAWTADGLIEHEYAEESE